MGCDIHTYIEIKRTVKDEEGWQCAERFELNPYYKPDNPQYADETEYEVDHIYNDRNYTLFAALAGVRDYGNEVEKLDDPRGLPDDINKIIADENERWGVDGHSHSWCTLQELYDYQDRNSHVTYKGPVSPEQAKALDEDGTPPNSWCQGTSDKSYVRRTWTVKQDVMERLIDAVEKRARKEHRIYWKDEERVERKYAQRTRLVFWFDN